MSAGHFQSLFLGGPYDGRYLELDPRIVAMIRLPHLDDWGIDNDPEATIPRDCPLLYVADFAADPPCFRFVHDES